MGGKPSSGTPADRRKKDNPGRGSESGSAPLAAKKSSQSKSSSSGSRQQGKGKR